MRLRALAVSILLTGCAMTAPQPQSDARLYAYLDQANKIEYGMRGEKGKVDVPAWAAKIEDWRTDAGDYIGSVYGAAAQVRFLTFDPVVGKGPEVYEYRRLIGMREQLVQLISEKR